MLVNASSRNAHQILTMINLFGLHVVNMRIISSWAGACSVSFFLYSPALLMHQKMSISNYVVPHANTDHQLLFHKWTTNIKYPGFFFMVACLLGCLL